MAQTQNVTQGGSVPAPGGSSTYRERHRDRRRREFLDAALVVVLRDGLSSLTMQRVTDEVGCSAGSIYQYFATKGALVAEMQHVALATLGGSLASSQAHVAALLHERDVDDAADALTRLVAAARFWLAAGSVYRREVELIRLLFTEPGEVVHPDEVGGALPSGLGLMAAGTHLFDHAAAAGALRPGDGFARTVTLLAATTGVQLTAGMARWEERLCALPSLAEDLVTDLLLAWGADSSTLRDAERVASHLAEQGRLVPPPREEHSSETG